jgi:DNA-binding transcriptional ArsR family regulator
MNAMTLNALAEPNRLRIVELLREKPYSVGGITEQLRLRQPQVSKHLRVLHEAGLVKVHPAAQQRIYHLQARPFEELESWLETFKRTWESRLDSLDEYVRQLKKEEERI